jgi:hypothetical protein
MGRGCFFVDLPMSMGFTDFVDGAALPGCGNGVTSSIVLFGFNPYDTASI